MVFVRFNNISIFEFLSKIMFKRTYAQHLIQNSSRGFNKSTCTWVLVLNVSGIFILSEKKKTGAKFLKPSEIHINNDKLSLHFYAYHNSTAAL